MNSVLGNFFLVKSVAFHPVTHDPAIHESQFPDYNSRNRSFLQTAPPVSDS